ncbi:hypothetical protein LCY76_20620 [Fictibacillus sp. KIGAM418]|uniref:Uncharacterized protein n=1 Tax=Fictibacillus marinisediminis TaxID=2878389 RepID=A0A9X1XDV1_9BACL|nr:hypothetical protein [Fictibacillus marinisediminis]
MREQLRDAVEIHDKISTCMTAKGYYHPYHLKEQINTRMM